MMDLSWRTRSNSNMVEFHFLEAEIIPLNGVAGAVNGAVGMSILFTLVSTPALMVEVMVSVTTVSYTHLTLPTKA